MRKWTISENRIADIRGVFVKMKYDMRHSSLSGDDVAALYERMDTLKQENSTLQAKIEELSHVDDIINIVAKLIEDDYYGENKPNIEAFAMKLHSAWPTNTRLVSVHSLYNLNFSDNPLRPYISNNYKLRKTIVQLQRCKIYEGEADKFREISAVARDIIEGNSDATLKNIPVALTKAIIHNLSEPLKTLLNNEKGIRNLQGALKKINF